MNFTAAGLSDVGLQREHNEDSFCILAEHRLFVVADGMGGHRAGDIASRMATTEMRAFFDSDDLMLPGKLEKAARSRGLLVTGGSDWHGPDSGRLGDFYVTSEEVGGLLESGGI